MLRRSIPLVTDPKGIDLLNIGFLLWLDNAFSFSRSNTPHLLHLLLWLLLLIHLLHLLVLLVKLLLRNEVLGAVEQLVVHVLVVVPAELLLLERNFVEVRFFLVTGWPAEVGLLHGLGVQRIRQSSL